MLRKCPQPLGNMLSHQLMHLDMVMRSLRSSRTDVTLYLDCTAWNSHLALVLASFRSGQPLFLSMWDQQLARKGYFRHASFVWLKWLAKLRGARHVIFEIDDDALPAKYRFGNANKIVTPMPRSVDFDFEWLDTRPAPDGRRLRIGLAGMIRRWKANSDASFLSCLSELARNRTDIELLAGFPRWQFSEGCLPPEFKFVDTAEPADYVEYVKSLDVLVANLNPNEYWFRTSGVVQDALSAGVYVVANNFPVVRAQLTQPCAVGAVFDSLEELGQLLVDVRSNLDSDLRARFKTWNASRSPAAIANRIAEELNNTKRSRTN